MTAIPQQDLFVVSSANGYKRLVGVDSYDLVVDHVFTVPASNIQTVVVLFVFEESPDKPPHVVSRVRELVRYRTIGVQHIHLFDKSGSSSGGHIMSSKKLNKTKSKVIKF
jgi:hypothetical protein